MISARRFCNLMPVAATVGIALAVPAFADEVNIYTTREPGLIQPLLDKFTEETGIETNTLFLKDGMPERVDAEGVNSPADLLMVVDIGNLVDLKEKGVTQAIESEVLEAAIPEQLRDPDGNWVALSLRARVFYTDKELGLTEFNYSELADPKWEDKVCIRSGQHPYNTAMFAAYLAHHGEAETVEWLKGIKANLAREAAGGDRDVARDILGDICDIGPANSYYVGRMRSGAGGPEQVEWGDAIKVVLPTFEDGGTHVNVSGAALAKNAPNKDAAIKLLEYLVSDEAQQLYADANYEYPVKPGVAPNEIIAALGELNVDTLPLGEIAAHRKTASKMVDETGFND